MVALRRIGVPHRGGAREPYTVDATSEYALQVDGDFTGRPLTRPRWRAQVQPWQRRRTWTLAGEKKEKPKSKPEKKDAHRKRGFSAELARARAR
ncbi:hypothetical protein A0H81_02029 [Grifola frondosa]|uniref:Uncharacterized protein n=1 Tax=Grifola frondosa TaxID=5627 RepID=A0A1C7MNP6_GRIFR|nr:hypothetical protein A0H81_02029 [Grifola frondosa]